MSLFTKKTLKILLKKYKIYPLKRLGQNFLVDKSAIKKIIEVADLEPEDIVLEIGPGVGNLSQELAKKVKKIILVEKDPRMIEILKGVLKDFKNVEIINKDILKISVSSFKFQVSGYRVVANLPFYLTAPAIRRFLESEIPPREMILIVQKEVAKRICSKPPDMSLLAVSVQFYAEAKVISYISRESFWPKPKVDGAIMKIVPYRFPVKFSPRLPERSGGWRRSQKQVSSPVSPSARRTNVLRVRDKFFKIVRAGFSQPRKQLINNLSKKLNLDRQTVKDWLLKSGVLPTQRAETLSLEEWIKVTKTCKIK